MTERLTKAEMEALLAAAGNIDPCMFEEMGGERGDCLYEAWLSGQEKLHRMLRSSKPRKARLKNRV